MRSDIALEVKQFIVDKFLFGQGGDTLSGTDSFLARGIIDSTGVLELVAFLEDRYKIQIDDLELLPENLDSIDRVAAFVETKRGGA